MARETAPRVAERTGISLPFAMKVREVRMESLVVQIESKLAQNILSQAWKTARLRLPHHVPQRSAAERLVAMLSEVPGIVLGEIFGSGFHGEACLIDGQLKQRRPVRQLRPEPLRPSRVPRATRRIPGVCSRPAGNPRPPA